MKRSAEKKVGITEHTAKTFAHQVKAKVMSSIFCYNITKAKRAL